MGGKERMKEFPPLVPQDITLKGTGTAEAVADIKLSSAGNLMFLCVRTLVFI